MPVNVRKDIRIPNPTKYFDPTKDRLFVTFPSDRSYRSRRFKINSMELRLYWQYKYCRSVGCDTYFYTLTYSDDNVPYKYGTNCFDYLDIREFLTGGFRKMLLRQHGLTFKYFIGAELGEGKGKRGLENNPHYHILFFLEPAKEFGLVGEPLTPELFRHYVRKYWQGFDQSPEYDGWRDYRTNCKYGIAKEGDHLGVVQDFRACSYVAKYVTKDVSLKMKELDIIKLTRNRLFYQLQNDLGFHKSFLGDVVKSLYLVGPISDAALLSLLLPDISSFSSLVDVASSEIFSEVTLVSDVRLACRKNGLWPLYFKYLRQKIDEGVTLALNEWRNRYCNKCRISNGVGLYALDMMDVDDLRIKLPSSKGIEYKFLPLYYYRKLFTSSVKPMESTFNNKYYKCPAIRVLNRQGICYKLSLLQSRLDRMSALAYADFSLVRYNQVLFDKVIRSDVNLDCDWSYSQFLAICDRLHKDIDERIVFARYAEYKIVYEDRNFEIGDIPKIDVVADFSRFLVPSVFSVPRSDLRIDVYLSDGIPDMLPYREHPYFSPFVSLFAFFDTLRDYFFVCADSLAEDDQRKRDAVRKFHVTHNLKFDV